MTIETNSPLEVMAAATAGIATGAVVEATSALAVATAAPRKAWRGQTHVQNESTLIVEEFGAMVGKHSERVRVTVKGETVIEVPLIHLRQVLIKGRGAVISTDAILACAERGIALHVVGGSARGAQAGASLYTQGLTGTVQTRRAQLLAYQDQRAVQAGLGFARAKITNQAALLHYTARNHKQSQPALSHELRVIEHEVLDHVAELDELAQRRSTDLIDDLRNALMSVEGRAAKRYWAGVRLILPAELKWEGRFGRGARDPFNSALNYGYAILARMVEQAVLLAGLDPFAGFVHADRPGKPSLTLDMIEEFRQPVVDRVLLGMVGKQMELAVREDGMLTDESRRAIAQRITQRLDESTERYEGHRVLLRVILQSQARHLATFLRGERPTYEGFVLKG